VSNYGDGVAPGTVSEFSIGAGGVLNLIGTATAGVEANEVVIGPGAQFAYTVNQGDNTVSLFSIAANGVLTAQGTAATGLNGPRNMVFDATGTYAYLTNRFGNTVQEYSLTAATGQLTPLGSVPAPSAEGITIDQTNSYVYVTDRATNAISEFSINHATGALTLVDTLVLPVGTTPTGIITAY
jgi:6-phosphogluconolactonase (cycloisomerase 2 family)